MTTTTLSQCTLLVLVILWCDASAGPGIDPKFLMELASQFDPSVLTQSCRKVFSKCKARIVPLVLQLESLLQNAPDLLDVECVQKELAKGFPRFDIECVMTDDYREGIQCMEDPKVLVPFKNFFLEKRKLDSLWENCDRKAFRDPVLDVLGPKVAKALKPLTNCFKDVPPPA